MNGTLFGKEISKQFPKKHSNKGAVYQGIAIRSHDTDPTPPESDGLVTGYQKPVTTSDAAPEAAPVTHTTRESDGCDGYTREVSHMPLELPIREGTLQAHPSHPSLSNTVNGHKPASDADADAVMGGDQPITNPSLAQNGSTPPIRCSTKVESRLSESHQQGTAFSYDNSGHAWCEKCEKQREFMNTGHLLAYPVLSLKHQGQKITIHAGEERWLKFAATAGYHGVAAAQAEAQKQLTM